MSPKPLRPDSKRSARQRIKVTIGLLHDALLTRILDGHHDRWEGRVGELAESAWMDALIAGVSPHVCPNRHCDCHMVLWEHTPPTLLDVEPEQLEQDVPLYACLKRMR